MGGRSISYRLRSRLDESSGAGHTLHPCLANIYASTTADLATALNAEDTREEAADILRGLIEKIVLTQTQPPQMGIRLSFTANWAPFCRCVRMWMVLMPKPAGVLRAFGN